MRVYITQSVKETEHLAYSFAKNLKPGDVVAFKGGLGMGKTAFVRGAMKALGHWEDVSSPTFAIMNHYRGNLNVYHFDLYRIHTEEDLESTGFFDFIDCNGIVFIEWSENVMEFLPKKLIQIQFEKSGDCTRKITIDGGARFDDISC